MHVGPDQFAGSFHGPDVFPAAASPRPPCYVSPSTSLQQSHHRHVSSDVSGFAGTVDAAFISLDVKPTGCLSGDIRLSGARKA